MSISYHELKDRILSETELAALLKGLLLPPQHPVGPSSSMSSATGDTIDDRVPDLRSTVPNPKTERPFSGSPSNKGSITPS